MVSNCFHVSQHANKHMNWFGQPHEGKKKFGKNETLVGEENIYSWDFHSTGVICGRQGHMVGSLG